MQPLHATAERGGVHLVEPPEETGEGMQPRHAAAGRGDVQDTGEGIKYLLHPAQDSDGCTSLHLAAARGRVNVLAQLLAAEGDIEAMEPINRRTPLQTAVTWGHAAVVAQLLAV